MSERAYLNLYTREAMAKTLALRDEQIDRLEDDNAKLRELIADVHEALCADKAGIFHRMILASMEDDMSELGIEVD